MRAFRAWVPALFLAGSALLAGCDTVGYYYQSVAGHLSLMAQRQSLDEAIDNARQAHDDKLARRLEDARAIRAYASRELDLPDNRSYRVYANIKRPFAVWNVFAAPELSVKLKEWCFLVVGCVTYRGYYDRAAAQGPTPTRCAPKAGTWTWRAFPRTPRSGTSTIRCSIPSSICRKANWRG